MADQSTLYKHTEEVDYLADQVGANLPADAIEVILQKAEKTLAVEQQTPIAVENTSGTAVDPATDSTVSSTLSREIANWTAGTLAVEQQTPVGVENSSGTQVDPATETTLATLAAVADALASVGTDTLQTEQQTPVGVEDAAGTQVDPRLQATYGSAYTTVDQNATGVTTVYDPATEAEVTGVFLNSTGSTVEMALEVTDGTDTATLATSTGGGALRFENALTLDAAQSLQVNVTTAEGAAQTDTAFVSYGEL